MLLFFHLFLFLFFFFLFFIWNEKIAVLVIHGTTTAIKLMIRSNEISLVPALIIHPKFDAEFLTCVFD